MKIKTKSLVVALLGLVMAMAMFFGVLTFGDSAVLADGAPTITMISGASARKTDEPGIRFTAKVDNFNYRNFADETDVYGMLILPEAAWANGIFDENTDNYHEYFSEKGITNYADVRCNHPYHDEGGQWHISASLYDIVKPTRSLVGVAYLLKDGEYTYTPVNLADNARSISYVAQMALKYETNLSQENVNVLTQYANAVTMEEEDLLGDNFFDVSGTTESVAADYALKYEFNIGGENVPFITKNAYAGGSTVSFKYKIPTGTVTSWWGVAWHTDPSNADIYYTAGVEDNDHKHYEGHYALSTTTGVWVDVSFTLPSGGPYYLYFGSEVGASGGRWMLNGENSYALIDDFTIGSTVENFGEDFTKSIFTIKTVSAVSSYVVKDAEVGFGGEVDMDQLAMKYIFNASGETVSQITKKAYAGGSTVSFKYYMPKGLTTQWWGLAWSTANTGLDIYAAADASKAHAISASKTVTGTWTDVSFTLPSGGPYYLYFGSEVGHWEMSDGSVPYMLIDDFAVNEGGTITTDTFNTGLKDCSFEIIVEEAVSTGEGYVFVEQPTMLAFDLASIGGSEKFAMVTDSNYKNVTEITFRAKWMSEYYVQQNGYWGLSYTTDPSKFTYEDDHTAVNVYSPKLGNLKQDVGVWHDYRIAIDISNKTYYVYVDGSTQALTHGTHSITSRISVYFYFVINPKGGEGTAFYLDDLTITTSSGASYTDDFDNGVSTLFVDSASKNANYGSTGMGFVAEEGGNETPEIEKLGDYAMKMMFNNGNDGVRAITKNAYAGGSTVSFRYFIQADQAVQWTRFIWDTDTTPDNYASTYVSFGNAQGEWTKWEYTLPEGGPYYLYLGFECGNWADSSGAPYILIDDFTVNGEIETFDYGAENCSFAILQSNLASIGEGGYIAPPPQALGAKLTIDLISSTKTTPSFITKQAYTLTEDTTITFDYFMSGNTNSKWWTFNWTSNNTDASIYAFVETSAVAFGTELNRVQDVWTSASVTVPAGTWYFYFAGAVGEWSGGYVIIDNFQVGDVVSENFNNGTDYGIFADNRDSKPDAITLANGKSDFVPGEYSVELDFTNSFENNASTFISKKAYAGGSVISFKYMIPNETTVGDWWSFNWTTNLASPDFWAVGNGAAEGCGGVNPNPSKNKGQGWVEYTVTLPAGGPYYLYFCGYSNWNGCVYIDDFTIWSTDGIFTDDFTNGANAKLFNVGNASYVSVGDGFVKELPEERELSAKIAVDGLKGTDKAEFITAQSFEAGSVVTFDYFIPSDVTFKAESTWWTMCVTSNPLAASVYSNHFATLPKVQGTWQTVTYTLTSAGHVYFAGAIGEWNGGCVYIDNFTVTSGDAVVTETFNYGVDNSIFIVNTPTAITAINTPAAERVFADSEIDAINGNSGYAYVTGKGDIDYTNIPGSMLIIEGSIKYEIKGSKEFAIAFGNGYFLFVNENEVSFYNGKVRLNKLDAKGNTSIHMAVTADGKVSVKVGANAYAGMGVMAKATAIKLVALGGDGEVAFNKLKVVTYKAKYEEVDGAPFYVSDDVIDFTAYAFDSDNMISDAGFQLLKDAGFTKTLALLQGRIDGYGDANKIPDEATVIKLMEEVNKDANSALALAEKYGLKHYVFNGGLYNIERQKSNYQWIEKIADLATYTISSAYAGHFFTDEPQSGKWFTDDELGELVTAYAKYKAVFPEGEAFINLLPRGATQFTSDDYYIEYIDDYIETLALDYNGVKGTGYVSYDHYPLETGGITGTHLRNLEIVAEKCRDNSLELRTYIKASENGDSERSLRATQSINDLYMQIYSALCYGSKEIIYYQFTDHTVKDGTAGDGVINGSSLNKSNVYNRASQANNEVKALSSAYMNFKWKSSSVFGSTSLTQFNKLKSKASAYGYISTVSSSAHVLIGNFDDADGNYTYGAKHAYMVQNYGNTGSSQAESSITITFNGTPKRALVYENGIPKVVTLTNNALTLNLELGEGAFVIPLI